MIYANFFSPNVISVIFCLHENTGESEDRDPHSEIVQFLIKKILEITESSKANLSNADFERQLLEETRNHEVLTRYRLSIAKINSFNDFYRQLAKMLKNLRSLRNNKLEQGNLVDFLVRRMYIYFQKLDFKQIIGIYEQFQRYKNERIQPPQHEFMLTKSIQELKFNLQNYNVIDPQSFAKQVLDLSQHDHTHKTNYLKALLKAGQHAPLDAVGCLHRYFDQSLGHLFQQKGQSQLSGNKINHCILSSGFIQLRMQQLEQCLQSISQGLRISQNNADEEAINNCIIYLYKISEQLGKFGEQILLNQHAITHSLNLNNIQLMVYSCLNYSLFERKYNCLDPNILLLKNRNISWTDALHFSKKKIYSTFESSCKNIYHTYRNLLIPSFMAKIAVLAHLPELKLMIINSYYDRPELNELEIYQQFLEKGKLNEQIERIQWQIKTGQVKLILQSLESIRDKQKNALSPLQIIKIRWVSILAKFSVKNYSNCYSEAEKLIELCRKYGYVKQEMLQAQILSIRALTKSQLYYEALVNAEIAKKNAKQQKLNEYETLCKLLQAQNYLHLRIHFQSALEIIQQIQLSSEIPTLRPLFKSIFYETKALANSIISSLFNNNIELKVQSDNLKRQQIQNLEQALKIYFSQRNFVNFYDVLQKMVTISQQIHIEKRQKLIKLKQYCSKMLKTFERLDEQNFDLRLLIEKIANKIHKLYFV